MNGRMEIRDRDGFRENLFGEFVCRSVGSGMLQASARKDETETGSLMPSPPSTVVGGRATKLCPDRDECFIEDSLFLEIGNESRERSVQLLDEDMLILLAFVPLMKLRLCETSMNRTPDCTRRRARRQR